MELLFRNIAHQELNQLEAGIFIIWTTAIHQGRILLERNNSAGFQKALWAQHLKDLYVQDGLASSKKFWTDFCKKKDT